MEFSLDESPAAQALGQKFKLTEARLWDDGSSEMREKYTQEPTKIMKGDLACGKSYSATRSSVFGLSPEEIELAEDLSILGLPLSFHSRKENINVLNSGKWKGKEKNYRRSPSEIEDFILHSLKMDEEESLYEPCDVLLQDVITKHETVETSDLGVDYGILHETQDRPRTNGLRACDLCIDDGTSVGSCLLNEDADVDACTKSWDYSDCNGLDNRTEHWDDYRSNVITEVDKWPRMEHLSFNDSSNIMFEVVDEVESSFDLQPCRLASRLGHLADDACSKNTLKRKKRGSKTKSSIKLSNSKQDLQGVLRENTPSISKYWCQRYLLFSRFDEGIEMDEEGWFSVTPEPIAKHHAIRCGDGLILDFFAGVGGNTIQFALCCGQVIAIDIDPNKIEYARHNSTIYGVADKVDFINGDSFSLASTLKADTVFMSPPWGGPDYSKVKKFDIYTMLKPHDGRYLFDIGTKIASKIVMFLPRNVVLNQLAELSLSTSPPWSLEVEKNFLNGRLKAVTAYFSEPTSPCSGEKRRWSSINETAYSLWSEL